VGEEEGVWRQGERKQLLVCVAITQPTATTTTTQPKPKNAAKDPNPEDPLNKDAAARLRDSARAFEAHVQRSIHNGMQIDGTWFPPCAG
jgi:hypothetical protein